MKRLLVLLFVGLFMMSGLSEACAVSPGHPQEIPAGAKVVFDRLPLEDVDVLLERAKAGMTDLQGDAEMVLDLISGAPGAGVEKYVTSQKLKEIRWLEEGLEQYLTTAFVFVTLPKDEERGTVTRDSGVGILSAQTAYDAKTDPSYSWKVEVWFNYTNQWDGEGNTYGKINNVKAKWMRLDSQGTANARMLAAANGPRLDGGWNNSKAGYLPTSGTFYPTSGQIYTLTPSNWDYTRYLDRSGMTIFGTYIAGAAKTELVRGDTKWRLDLDIVKGDVGSYSY